MISIADILPKIGEHSALLGQTGTGKTWLARRLLLPRRYVIIFDSKGFIDWKEYKLYTTLQEVLEAKDEKIIYRPTFEELQDEGKVNLFFGFIYARCNTFLYVDETPSVATSSNKPSNLLGCLQRGRERGISVLCGSQRPVDIPQAIFSESKHYYIFREANELDRRRIAGNIPIRSDVLASLKEEEFLYFNFNTGLRGPLRVEDK